MLYNILAPALFPGGASAHRETFEKYEFLFEFEEGDPALAGLTTGIRYFED
jgi:hypothetical protein